MSERIKVPADLLSDGLPRDFPARLRAWRKAQRISQWDLAVAAGLKNDRNITEWENGHYLPSLEHAVRLAAALGIKVSDLIGDNRRGFDFDQAFPPRNPNWKSARKAKQ